MSRIGRLPIAVPSGVEVTIDGRDIQVKGPKGVLSRTIAEPITIDRNEEGQLVVERPNDERESRSLHGLTRTLVNNMVIGVTDGYSKTLEIVGVGYRVVQKSPAQIEFALGFSHPVVVDAPEGIAFEVETPQRLHIRGIDKQAVGEIAANIRKIRQARAVQGQGCALPWRAPCAARLERLVSDRGYLAACAQAPCRDRGARASRRSWPQAHLRFAGASSPVVTKSARHTLVQIIDDVAGRTLASASTMEPEVRKVTGDKSAKAIKIGELIAKRAKDAVSSRSSSIAPATSTTDESPRW